MTIHGGSNTRCDHYLVVLCVALSACTVPQSFVRPAPARTSCVGLVSEDSTVFDTTQVSEKPQAISGPMVAYPDDLRRRLINGHVVLAVVINADGRPDQQSVVVLRSDRPPFVQEALRWVAGATYWPGCREGHAVRVRVAVPVDFTVKG